MEKTPKKKRAKKPTTSIKVTGYGPDWFNYPPEWDEQMKSLQEDYDREQYEEEQGELKNKS